MASPTGSGGRQTAGSQRGGGGSVIAIPVTLESDVVNLAATGVTSIPNTTIPGFVFLPLTNPRWKTVSVAGNISTAPTVKSGNNAGRDNMMISAAAPTTAAFAAGVNGYASGGANAVNTAMADLSTGLSVQVVTAATGTGGFAWTARLYQVGLLMPV